MNLENLSIENLLTTLNTVQKTARARLLDYRDVQIAVSAYCRGVALAGRLGVDPSTIIVKIDGGSVSKNYGARAERTVIIISRGAARIVRDKAPETGESAGRLVLSMDFPPGLKTGRELPDHNIVEGAPISAGRKYNKQASWG